MLVDAVPQEKMRSFGWPYVAPNMLDSRTTNAMVMPAGWPDGVAGTVSDDANDENQL